MIYKIDGKEYLLKVWNDEWNSPFFVEPDEIPRWLWLRLVPNDALFALWCSGPGAAWSVEMIDAFKAELARREDGGG